MSAMICQVKTTLHQSYLDMIGWIDQSVWNSFTLPKREGVLLKWGLLQLAFSGGFVITVEFHDWGVTLPPIGSGLEIATFPVTWSTRPCVNRGTLLRTGSFPIHNRRATIITSRTLLWCEIPINESYPNTTARRLGTTARYRITLVPLQGMPPITLKH